MRMFYLLEEDDEFAAGTAVLVDRCLLWARETGAAADAPGVLSALQFRHMSTDGRLGHWTAPLVREFLLDWIPWQGSRRLEPRHTPASLDTLLRYLDHTGLLHPASDALAELQLAIAANADAFHAALSDAASKDQFERDRILAGKIDQIGFTERLPAQLPVRLPSEDELTGAAAESSVVRQVSTLVAWLGTAGRQLTATGLLKLADARELVDLLKTGDEVDPVIGDRVFRTHSSAALPRLMLVVELAKLSRLIRVRDNRLVRVAKNQRLLDDPVELWRRMFTSLTTEPNLVWPSDRSLGPGILAMDFAAHMTDVCNAVYGLPEPIPLVRLTEPIWQAACDMYAIDSAERSQRELWRDMVDWDLRRALGWLQDLGAVELSTGVPDPMFRRDLDNAGEPPWPPDALRRLREALAPGAEPVELVRLTPLGSRAVRERLLDDGRVAPLVGELVDARPDQLLGTLADHYTPETAKEEIVTWLQAHGGEADGGPTLLDAIGRCPFRSRAAAMLTVLGYAQPNPVAWLRGLRGHPRLGPIVTASLVNDHGLAIDDLTPEERAQAFTEHLLHLLEVGGPDVVLNSLASVPAADWAIMREDVRYSGHPDAAGVAMLESLLSADRPSAAAHPLAGVARRSRARDRRKPRNRKR